MGELRSVSAVSTSKARLWLPIAALAIASLYLPSLQARFDFIDDGNLVYADGPMPLGQRLHLLWQRIEANYHDLGPFRPVLWLHWTVFAETLRGSELGWRAVRLMGCFAATGMLLWLLRELRIARWACIIAAASAIWNPFRSEIWTSNTLAEGVAMPYALFALVAARRATTSKRAWLWDLGGILGVLAALGCKNTFAALIPAQMFLRFAQDDLSLRQGWRRHRARALLLSTTVLLPIAHLIYFKLHWHPGQYTTNSPSFANLLMILSGYKGGISLELLGAGLFLALLLVAAALWRRQVDASWRVAVAGAGGGLWSEYRAAVGSACLLIGAGVVVYLPVGAMSGRYVMPGIWGVDILIGLLLTRFSIEAPSGFGKRLAWSALGAGLFLVAGANLGKQEKHMARTTMLWETLEWVERQAPSNAAIAWYGGALPTSPLNVEEGVHFAWHLAARKKSTARVAICDEQGHLNVRTREFGPCAEPIAYRIVGAELATHEAGWHDAQRFARPYRVGLRKYECVVQSLDESAEGAHASAKTKQ
jgi:hypothetical protein